MCVQPVACRQFQEEVESRARKELQQSSSGMALPSGGKEGGAAAAARPPDYPELVDNLRADIAATRAVVQQIKAQEALAARASRRR